MDGENNGFKPYEQMDDLGVPLFLETPVLMVQKSGDHHLGCIKTPENSGIPSGKLTFRHGKIPIFPGKYHQD